LVKPTCGEALAVSARQRTYAPFGEALLKIKRERGLSFRDLERATRSVDPAGRGLSGGHISRLCNGLDAPAPAGIALIAKTLGLSPGYFVEYRLAQARSLFDERATGGFEAAVGHLKRLEAHFGSSVNSTHPVRRRRRAS
jgi:transcriptional regulator with XRE-family HTH domain